MATPEQMRATGIDQCLLDLLVRYEQMQQGQSLRREEQNAVLWLAIPDP